jgi:hypothetical protein
MNRDGRDDIRYSRSALRFTRQMDPTDENGTRQIRTLTSPSSALHRVFGNVTRSHAGECGSRLARHLPNQSDEACLIALPVASWDQPSNSVKPDIIESALKIVDGIPDDHWERLKAYPFSTLAKSHLMYSSLLFTST